MIPIVDFYDAVSLVPVAKMPDGESKLASIMEKVGSLQVDPERGATEGLCDMDYALVYQTKTGQECRYRIDSPEQASLSLAAFDVFGRHLSPAQTVKTAGANIINACERHGVDVPEHLAEFRDGSISSNTAPEPFMVTKVAQANDADYAIRMEDGSLRYPLRSGQEVKEASAYFDRWHKEFPIHHRPRFASAVMKKAAEFKVPVSPQVAAYSGEGYSSLFKGAMDARVSDCVNEEHKADLFNLAGKAGHISPEKFAESLFEIDVQYGQTEKYGQHIADPWTSVFYNPIPVKQQKTAEQKETSMILEKVASGKAGDILGDDVVAKILADPTSATAELDPATLAALRAL